MSRIDLYVSPEEYATVRRLGAHWDEQLKCWYIDTASRARRFARWLGNPPDTPDTPDTPDAPGDQAWDIESHRAYVASTSVRCSRCQRRTEVICVYCRSGTVLGEPLVRFTVHEIHAVDGELARQLERWPAFALSERHGLYVNHCQHCSATLTALHCEPHQPFYDVAGSSALVLTALHGTVRLSGEYSVDV